MKDPKELIESDSPTTEIISRLTEGLRVRDFSRRDYMSFGGAGDFPDGTPAQRSDIEPKDINFGSFGFEHVNSSYAHGTALLSHDPPSGTSSVEIYVRNGGSDPDDERVFNKGVRDFDEGMKVLYDLKLPLNYRQLQRMNFQEL